MKILALTGGIAAGKSTVARLFSELGATIIDADKVAHELYLPGGACHRALVQRYGKGILDPQKKNPPTKTRANPLFLPEREGLDRNPRASSSHPSHRT